MGYNTVAVLFNDFDFESQPELGKRIKSAMRGYTWPDKGRRPTHFGCGEVISQDHADSEQVVVVGRNTGYRLDDCNALDMMTQEKLADALRRHGWSVKKPGRRKVAA